MPFVCSPINERARTLEFSFPILVSFPFSFPLQCSSVTMIFILFPFETDQNLPFVILLCLTPDEFTREGRASGWERVNLAYLPISLP